MTQLSSRARALEHKTPWYRRMLGAPIEKRVEVVDVLQYPSPCEPKTRIYLREKGKWRIEESLYEFVEN